MAKLSIVFWSQTGNTEAMANAIAESAASAGADVELKNVSEADREQVLASDVIVLGCPAMGAEVLEEDEFDPFYTALEPHLAGKKVALFGSYGWGDGEWMREWEGRVREAGALLYHDAGLIVNDAPEGESLEETKAFGTGLASF